MRSFIFAVLVVMSVGCGAPKSGDSCDKPGLLCADATSALECRLGKLATLPCRGPDGCKKTGDQIVCDMRGNVVGDGCASMTEGSGLCNATGDAALQCRQGVLEKVSSCKTCSVSNGQVNCQP